MLYLTKWNIGPYLLALVLLIASIARVADSGAWEANLMSLLFLLAGFVMFVFSDRVQEMMDADQPHAEWFQRPPTYVRIAGGVMLLYGAAGIFDLI